VVFQGFKLVAAVLNIAVITAAVGFHIAGIVIKEAFSK
jgi:hypothetical protein